jgi:hypothetical protein
MFERDGPIAVVVFPEIVDFTRHVQFLSRGQLKRAVHRFEYGALSYYPAACADR